jgi:hypothetical protein
MSSATSALLVSGETPVWLGGTVSTVNATPPFCKKCGSGMAVLGKLPKIGFHPLVLVYKCRPCSHVVAIPGP